MRKKMTLLCLLTGIGLAVASFIMAIPADPFGSTPKVPFASVFFIVGVMLSFLSAVVYELMPNDKPSARDAYKPRSLHR